MAAANVSAIYDGAIPASSSSIPRTAGSNAGGGGGGGDTLETVQRAAEILLEQDLCRRTMAQQLASQMRQIKDLEAHLTASTACTHEQRKLAADNQRLYEQVLSEKDELALENVSLIEKVRTLENAVKASETRCLRAHDECARLETLITQRDAQIGDLEAKLCGYQLVASLDSKTNGLSSSSFALVEENTSASWMNASAQGSRLDTTMRTMKPFLARVQQQSMAASTQVFQHHLQASNALATRLEQLVLSDNVYDGMIQTVSATVDAVVGMLEESFGTMETAPQSSQFLGECRGTARRLLKAQERLMADIKEKHTAHRLLKRTFKEKEATLQELTAQLRQTQSESKENPDQSLRETNAQISAQLQRAQADAERVQKDFDKVSTELTRVAQQNAAMAQELHLRDTKAQEASFKDLVQTKVQALREEFQTSNQSKMEVAFQQQIDELKREMIPKTDHLSMIKEMETNFISETKEIIAASDQHLASTLLQAEEKHEKAMSSLKELCERHRAEAERVQAALQTTSNALASTQAQLAAALHKIGVLESDLDTRQKSNADQMATLGRSLEATRAELAAQTTAVSQANTRMLAFQGQHQQVTRAVASVLQTLSEIRTSVKAASVSFARPSSSIPLLPTSPPALVSDISFSAASTSGAEMDASIGGGDPNNTKSVASNGGQLASALSTTAHELRVLIHDYITSASRATPLAVKREVRRLRTRQTAMLSTHQNIENDVKQKLLDMNGEWSAFATAINQTLTTLTTTYTSQFQRLRVDRARMVRWYTTVLSLLESTLKGVLPPTVPVPEIFSMLRDVRRVVRKAEPIPDSDATASPTFASSQAMDGLEGTESGSFEIDACALLRPLMDSLHEHHQEVVRGRARVQELEQELEIKTSAVKTLKEELATSEIALSDLRRQHEDLQAKFEGEMAAHQEALAQKVVEYRTVLDGMCTKIQEEANRSACAELDRTAVTESLHQINSEKERLQCELVRLGQELDETHARYAEQLRGQAGETENGRKQLTEVIKRLGEAETQNATLHARILQKEDEISSLIAALNPMKEARASRSHSLQPALRCTLLRTENEVR